LCAVDLVWLLYRVRFAPLILPVNKWSYYSVNEVLYDMTKVRMTID
jgi:hypothetical protein